MRLIMLLIALLINCLPAQAAVNLELTQGRSAAMPIAIVPFANEQQAMAVGNQSLSDIIKNDLTYSGEFKVISPGMLDAKPTSVAQIDSAAWRKKGANQIVIGSVTPQGGRYQVTYQLVSLFNKTGDAANSGVLASETFTVNQAQLRNMAHAISDSIYQKITGVRGVFSTKISYIMVQKNSAGLPVKYTLEIADMDGFNPRPMVSSNLPIMSPSWSPTGRDIAYVSFEGNEASIYVQDVASGRRSLLSRYPGINGAPAFSPDGKKLALVLTLSGNPKVYIYDLGSRRLNQITQGYSIDTEPAWSPDGQSLLFTSDSGGTPQIYQYSLATRQTQRVTFDGDYNARAAFLPDRKGIIVMHRQGGLFGIARQDFGSGRIQVLTQSGRDESPSLSPNGKMVIYATRYGSQGVLSVVSTDGRVKLRLPARDGDVQEPAWSPFLG